jgi:hypothetical protein
MQKTPLGWHVTADGSGYRWVEKNGGWGANGTTITTSIALFGPGVFGALFINSDVLGPGLQNNWQWCKNARRSAAPGTPAWATARPAACTTTLAAGTTAFR